MIMTMAGQPSCKSAVIVAKSHILDVSALDVADQV